MFKKKKAKPAVEIGLNLAPLLESLGLEKFTDRVLGLIEEGRLEVKVEIGKKKGKVPASLTVRLKKAEK